MDKGVSVVIGDINIPIRRNCSVSRMVERRAETRPVPISEHADRGAFGCEDENLVSISIDKKHAIIGCDEDAMCITDVSRAPSREKFAGRIEDDHRRIRPLIDVEISIRVESELADQAECHIPWQTAPRSFDAVEAVAENHSQSFVNRVFPRNAGSSFAHSPWPASLASVTLSVAVWRGADGLTPTLAACFPRPGIAFASPSSASACKVSPYFLLDFIGTAQADEIDQLTRTVAPIGCRYS